MVYPTLKNVKSLSNCNKMELHCSTISLKTNTSSLLLGKKSINFFFPVKHASTRADFFEQKEKQMFDTTP